MLKRNVYTDFSQFVAALKSAERLGLHYRVERRVVDGTTKVPILKSTHQLFAPLKMEMHERPTSWVEYTLDLLPDAEADAGARDTA